MRKTIGIEGMSCEGCSGRIERLLNAMDGVEAKVSLEDKQADVELTGNVDDATLKSTIENAGFTVTSIG